MLGIMRKYKQSVIIKVVFGIIVFSFIGTIFLVWGRGDKGLAGGYVARVNGTKITGKNIRRVITVSAAFTSRSMAAACPPSWKSRWG